MLVGVGLETVPDGDLINKATLYCSIPASNLSMVFVRSLERKMIFHALVVSYLYDY